MKILSIGNIPQTEQCVNFESKLKPRNFMRPQKVKPLFAYRDFIKYSPIKKVFEGYKNLSYTLPVHNEGISQKMKSKYSAEEFKNLYNFAKSKGTFDYTLDSEKGTVKTSQINIKENHLMSSLIWVTDSCHNIDLVKDKNPEACTAVFNRLAEFYEGQKANFAKVFENPTKYAENRLWDNKFGVGHVFTPATNKEHHWFANTRLESLGNYLRVGSELITEGFNGAKYGYKTAEDVPQTVVDSIANITRYLKEINYPQAPSCGAWEENTFQKSLTSDTAIINESMRKLNKLMFSATENKELIKFRERILNSENGDVFKDKTALDNLLKQGEKRIEKIHFVESPRADFSIEADWQKRFYNRKSDAAMTFAPQTETFKSGSVVKDALAKIDMLKSIEKDLVKENGALRYQGDEYLTLDYHTLKDKWQDNKKTNEAEWFLVSEFAKAYGTVAKDIMNDIKSNGISWQKEKILEFALAKQTEYINRSYARITPKGMTKSNGYSCPAYKLPEAYEAVTTKKGVKYVPGAHTPLTWAETSLDSASKQFIENLKQYELLIK